MAVVYRPITCLSAHIGVLTKVYLDADELSGMENRYDGTAKLDYTIECWREGNRKLIYKIFTYTKSKYTSRQTIRHRNFKHAMRRIREQLANQGFNEQYCIIVTLYDDTAKTFVDILATDPLFGEIDKKYFSSDIASEVRLCGHIVAVKPRAEPDAAGDESDDEPDNEDRFD